MWACRESISVCVCVKAGQSNSIPAAGVCVLDKGVWSGNHWQSLVKIILLSVSRGCAHFNILLAGIILTAEWRHTAALTHAAHLEAAKHLHLPVSTALLTLPWRPVPGVDAAFSHFYLFYYLCVCETRFDDQHVSQTHTHTLKFFVGFAD